MLKNLLTADAYQNHRKALFWLILASLLFLTLTPTPPKPIKLDNIDKIYHFTAFAGFTFVFCIAFNTIKPLIILLVSVFLGAGIEVAQYFVPGRGFSFADMAADGLGALSGFGVVKMLTHKSHKLAE